MTAEPPGLQAPPGPPTPPLAEQVRWLGRADLTRPERPRFSWSGSGFAARFSGTGLSVDLASAPTARLRLRAIVDGNPRPPLWTMGSASHRLAFDLTAGPHTLELVRDSEGMLGECSLTGLSVADGALLSPPRARPRFIEVVGDSISCGYGNLGTLADDDGHATQSHFDAYPALLGRLLDADVSTIAASGFGVVRDYEGHPEGVLSRIFERAISTDPASSWGFGRQPQAVLVNLGTNDVANGKGDPGVAFRRAYADLLRLLRERYPYAVILCLVAPMLGGRELAAMNAHIVAAVDARRDQGDGSVLFTDCVGPQSSDATGVHSHPSLAEHRRMAGLLAPELAGALGW